MADDTSIARLIEALKEPVRLDPAIDNRVMAEIERLTAQRAAGSISLTTWLRRRTIRLSPIGAAGLAAIIAAVVLIGSSIAGRAGAPEPLQSDRLTGQTQMTQFVLVEPSARSVAVVGDFNDWNASATPLMREAGDGVWWIALPLSPGRYRYAFVVDGTEWRGDPDAPTENEFGRPSSVVSIGGA